MWKESINVVTKSTIGKTNVLVTRIMTGTIQTLANATKKKIITNVETKEDLVDYALVLDVGNKKGSRLATNYILFSLNSTHKKDSPPILLFYLFIFLLLIINFYIFQQNVL